MCVCVCVSVSEEGVCDNLRFSLNDRPVETVEYIWVNIWCMLDWIIGFCHHLENSIFSAHVKPSLENNFSNLLISIGVVIKITVYIDSIKFNFM